MSFEKVIEEPPEMWCIWCGADVTEVGSLSFLVVEDRPVPFVVVFHESKDCKAINGIISIPPQFQTDLKEFR